MSEGGAGRISRIDPAGAVEPVLEGLSGPGDYHGNVAVVGPDRKLYLSQGSMTNTAIVGDSVQLGWLGRIPEVPDIPGVDVILAGVNVDTDDRIVDRCPGTCRCPGRGFRPGPCAAGPVKKWEPTASSGLCPGAPSSAGRQTSVDANAISPEDVAVSGGKVPPAEGIEADSREAGRHGREHCQRSDFELGGGKVGNVLERGHGDEPRRKVEDLPEEADSEGQSKRCPGRGSGSRHQPEHGGCEANEHPHRRHVCEGRAQDRR